MNELIGIIVMSIGVIFVTFGEIGMFVFKDFYGRVLISSLVDTVGFITVMLGVIVYEGFNMFSLGILLILITVMILGPINTHFITKSAYLSGYNIKKRGE